MDANYLVMSKTPINRPRKNGLDPSKIPEVVLGDREDYQKYKREHRKRLKELQLEAEGEFLGGEPDYVD